jgi:hypothetical protein
MPQPVAFNTGSAISGSIQTSKISYAVDGDNKDYRGGYAGKTWYSELPATNGVVFAKDTTSIGRGVSGSMAFWTSATTSSADILFTANRLPGPFHYFSDTGSAYSWSFNNGYFINDPNEPLTNTISDGLILYLDAAKMQSMQAGVPTTNLLRSSSMEPLNSGSEISTTNSVSQANVGSSGWNWNVYAPTNVSPEGGMDWLPTQPDPLGGIGVWKMRKRPGGNAESNWECTFMPISISSTLSYTISVYCRTTVAGTARIHINTTRNGASYWGFASANHTGDGTWQRLSVTIPANDGNTSINTVRCQAYGTNINAEIYWKYYQVEAKSTATPYITGSRAVWLDMSGNNYSASLINGPLYNDGTIVLDGIDDYITQNYFTSNDFSDNQSWTIDALVNVVSSESAGNTRGGILTNQLYQSQDNPGGFGLNIITQTYCINLTSGSTGNAISYQQLSSIAINYNKVERITAVWDSGSSTAKIYRNGVLGNSSTSTSYRWSPRSIGTVQHIGTSTQGGWSYYFPMKLYNLALYNKALSDAEIKQNYYGGPIVTDNLVLAVDAGNVVSYESGSTTTYSLTGSLNGSLINGVGYLPNNGGTWDFDGTDDYLNFSVPSALNFTSSDAFSTEAWINWDGGAQPNNAGHIIGKTYGNYRTFFINSINPGIISFRLGLNTLNCDTPSIISANTWYQVVSTFNPSTFTSKVYVNGVERASNTNVNINWSATNGNFQIGNSPGENYYFNGKITNGRVYNKTLTPEEVSQNFNAQRQRFGI